jgi:PAS domain S-box-containing protein
MSAIAIQAQLAAPLSGLTSSIRSKLILFAVAQTLVAALVLGAAYYGRIVEVTRNAAVERLQGQARLIVPQLQLRYEILKTDAFTISRTPPFQGLRRAYQNGGIDPRDGSTVALWRDRLETIFLSVMEQHPSYMQMRFVGVADNGREIVRVNRKDGELRTVPPGQLQEKIGEFYFAESLRLTPGRYYLSPITLNRDWGRVEQDLAVMRAVVPIASSDDGRLFGFLVVNIDASSYFRSVLEGLHVAGETTIVTDTNDLMRRSPNGASINFLYRGAVGSHPSSIAKLLQRATTSDETHFRTIGGVEQAVYVTQLNLDDVSGQRFLKVALAVPVSELLDEAVKTRNSALFVSSLLILLFLLLSFMMARQLTKPLATMAGEVRSFGKRDRRLHLPTWRRDEIGDLSRAFESLVGELESAATERLERINSMRENAADAMVAADDRLRIIAFNRGAEQLFGYKAEEMIGRNVAILVPDSLKGEHDGYIGNYLETGERKNIGKVRKVEAQRKDGSWFPAELRLSAISVKGRQVFDGVIRDISDRVEMEQDLVRHTAALERSNQALNDFAYIASHDLKEPLRAISNHACFLKEDYGAELGEDGKRRIDRLQALAQRLDRLISDLLKWSRLGNASMKRQPTDLNGLLGDLRGTLAETLEENDATLTVVEPLPTICCDPARIESLIRNLIVNGIKYNDKALKTVEIGVRGKRRADNGKEVDVFYVRDNGIGILPEFHDTIFVMFKRLNSEKVFGPGSGAGLAFVKKIVEVHGGSIWLESEQGVGTTFYFTLYGTST